MYSTYLGGYYDDEAHAIAVDSAGQAYVTGYTDSRNFPVANATQPYPAGYYFYYDAFVTRLNASGASLPFSTFLGGSYDFEEGDGIAVDADKNIYVVGDTYSPDFPTLNALQSYLNGGLDAFITKYSSPLSSIQISGRVTLENGRGLSGVTITLTSNGAPMMTTTTGAGGSYSFANLPGGRNYTITPSKTGSDGIYMFANLPAGGDYTVTPSKSGYTFSPPSRTFTNLRMSQSYATSSFDGMP